MQKIMIIALCLMLAGCASKGRLIKDLEPLEQEKLNALLNKRKTCLLDNLRYMDDYKTDVQTLAEQVAWKCRQYPEIIRRTLYEQFNVAVGEAWLYGDGLESQTTREAMDAILEQRRQYRRSNPEDELLRAQ